MSHIDTDSDDDFQQDIDALRRACSVTGLKIDDVIRNPSSSSTVTLDDDDDDDLFHDMELLRDIKKRFSVQDEVVMKPLNTILPDVGDGDSDIDDGDYGGDFETLRAIQRRFSRYNDSVESPVRIPNKQGFEGREPGGGSEIVPASAQAFVEAIKKNRAYQKFLREKLIHVEARMEENKKLRERVKFLKGFQVNCRKMTGRALSQKNDPRFQLITVPKLRANASKKKDTSTRPINQGPAQNPQVAIYNAVKLNYPDYHTLRRKPWSEADSKNLVKGIKQQIQEMMMQNLFTAENADSSNMDTLIIKIKKREITAEEIRSFLPQVDWEQLASMYLNGRSGPECESRWRNCEDPLINHGDWTKVEQKKMLHCFSNRGFSNWIDIAKELNTNRTPYQCLVCFQRSINPSILNRDWTPTEEEELRKAVAKYGENNWQLVASVLTGRTRTQCANKWSTSLNPLKEREGKWDSDEDKRLKIAVRLFGAKNFNKITKYVPGRTQVQCRERWVNCLDPSINKSKFTEEEDMKLKAAVEEHNMKWAQVAKCLPGRTDSHCRRRWKKLFPHQFQLLKAAKEIEKRFLVSNFVDREKERPQLSYKDFNKPLLLEAGPKANEDNIISKDKKQRTVGKDRPGKAKKVDCTGKARKLVDEDDVEYNDGQADITSNGDRENCDVEEEATGKSKSQGKERSITKVYVRRARQVGHTAKVLKLIDEDVGEDNDGHGNITSNGGLTRQSVKNKGKTLLEDAGLLEQDNGEGIRTFNGDNCEMKKKPTQKRKRKQRVNDEHGETDKNCEQYEEIFTNKRNKHDSMSVSRSSSVPLMIKDVPSRDERCFSEVVHKSMSGDGSCGHKKNTDVKISTREREAVDGSCGYGEIVLEDEETFANFVSKRNTDNKNSTRKSKAVDGSCGHKKNTDVKNSTRKRKAVDGSCGFGEIVLEDEETFANFVSKRNTDVKISTRKREAVDASVCFGEIVLEDEETFAKFLSKRKKEES